MKERPYTTTELFDAVCQKLKDLGQMPEILDYHSGSHNPEPIKYYEYKINAALNSGGSEGVYLDIGINLWLLPESKEERLHLGTFKTLRNDAEAFRTMGELLGDFVYQTEKFIDENIDDFTWYGYEVRGYTLEGQRMGCEVPTLEKANRRRDEFFARHDYAFDSVTITDNTSIPKKVTEWSRAEWVNLMKMKGGVAL